MKDNQEFLLNKTINVIKESKVERHKNTLESLEVYVIVEMILLLKDSINNVLYDFVNMKKEINLPSIGILRIKKNRVQVKEVIDDYLEEYNVKTEQDLPVEVKEELKKIKIDIANSNKASVVHNLRLDLAKNISEKLKK